MRKILAVGALLPLFGAMAASAATINATGASFPAPIYQKWFEEYKAKTGIQINYQGLGSGAGVKALTEGTVDFAASDAPLTDAQSAALKTRAFHFPTVLGAVVITYNVPGVSTGLKFSGPTIADIYLGKITKWDDPKIKADNPGVKLPTKDNDIVVVHRADASGTSFIFTDYLSKVSPEWKSKVGASTSVQWPVGQGGAQNAGVAGLVKQTPGSIGYVELIYAVQQNMGYADVKNAAGKWIRPSFEGVTAAAASAQMPADFRVSITNAPGDKAYPISSFTWMLIPSHIADASKKKAITDFLNWMLTDGQKECQAMSYAPLPASVVAKEKKQIAEIQ
ncbi:MAG TPA: phosphate ABC transporter substrate-binding protein PstS [Bryobacteraceae bacterium]|nr:phosphate ABC transporter substrate-binding protein PstS [Bryobacteraceae bacterium]